jgi:type VI secretion system protein ImpH
VTTTLDALFADATTFDFFQALRLIEQRWPGALERSTTEQREGVRASVRPHDGLSFPASDVHTATIADRKVDLVVTFLGLYGVDSPLPAYFGDAASAVESGALRSFLDIFGHRLYVLLYESWRKYRIALGNDASANENLRRLSCLAGLGALPATGRLSSRDLLPLAATLRNEVRNAEGLARLVSAFFPAIPVTIVENVPRWVSVSDRPRLGRSRDRILLGDSAFLGENLLDASGKFRIVLGPLSWDQFEAFHPEGESAEALRELVALYARDALAYDVELRVRTTDVPVTRLRCPKNRLGLTTWIGRPSRAIVSEILEYSEPHETDGRIGITPTRRTIQ